MSRRKPLSLTALRTHRALLILMGSVASTLFIGYVFLMNHLSMQGYLLSIESENLIDLSQELGQLESRVARIQTHEFITKSVGTQSMLAQEFKSYLVVPNIVTARK